MGTRQGVGIYHGWFLLALAFFTMLVAYSLRYNFSVFYVAILAHFGWGRAETAAGFSINLIVYAVSCPLAGNLVDRFGVRITVPVGAFLLGIALAGCSLINAIWQFYLIIGLTAFGTCSMGFVAHVPMIANWFFRRRGLALGILSAGVTASAVIAPGVQYLISTISWKGAFLVLAGISAFVVAPLAAIFDRQHPEDMGMLPEGMGEPETAEDQPEQPRRLMDRQWASQEWTPARAMRTSRFWWLALMCLFLGFYCYTLLAHQVAYLTDAGYSRAFAAGIVAVFCIVATLSSFGAFISDYLGRELTFTLSSVCTAIGVTILMLTRDALHPWMPYTYALVFGFGYGLCLALMAVTSADLFQGRHYGAINGILMALFVFGGAVGPWFAGYVFDVTGTYKGAFLFMFLAIFASAAFIWLAAPRKVRAVPGRLSQEAG
jgi:sugar phosphate permease